MVAVLFIFSARSGRETSLLVLRDGWLDAKRPSAFRDVITEQGRSKWFSETLHGVIGDADATKL